MRPLKIILAAACIIFLAVSVLIKPLIMMLASNQLAKVFTQSRVSIKGCAIRPASRISLFDIEIKKPGVYDIKVKEAAVYYHLFSMPKPGSLGLFLQGCRIYVNTPQQGIRELASNLNLGRQDGHQAGRQVFGQVEVSALALDVNTQDLTVQADLSSRINLAAQTLDYLDFKMGNFKFSGVQLEDVSLKLRPDSGQGGFSIAQIKYGKLKVTDIKGKASYKDMSLSLNSVSAKALGGDIKGELNIDRDAQYSVKLKCANLDIGRLVEDFDLREKIDMTGKISGDLKLQGKGGRIEILSGGFPINEPGGMLIIRDTKLLENMARNSQQPLDLFVESFKNYRYNTGLMSLELENGNINLKVGLEGDAGKRNLNVVLHDFLD
jgi:hypothetical protein